MMVMNDLKKEMWLIYSMKLPQSMTHCNWCYHIYDNLCECAERRFYNRLTERQIQEYIGKINKTEIEREIKLKQSEIKELENVLKLLS